MSDAGIVAHALMSAVLYCTVLSDCQSSSRAFRTDSRIIKALNGTTVQDTCYDRTRGLRSHEGISL